MNCLDEKRVLAFAEGCLESTERAEVEGHLAGCQSCADLVAEAAVLAPRRAVGRYVVLQVVGRGGMGEVYAAYDTELDRKVALKLLRPHIARSDVGHARLMREAQAIAKLSHPNVVVVHEVGTFEGSVFVVMEFVRGQTLSAWLAAKPRGWREVLRVFFAAGHGLAAAHAVGIVHRDFKPENVMIRWDGQVRVMDFGLARHISVDGAADVVESAGELDMLASISDETGPSSSGGYLAAKITQTGIQVGTPAYMAPEQFFSTAPIGPRSDQFSFCVALYEALYGERPFAANSVPELRTKVLAGRISAPSERRYVPGWIRRVLLRGLAVDPAERFPSMTALLRALDQDPSVRRRKWLTAGGIVLLVVAVAVAARRLGSAGSVQCDLGVSRLAGIWEPAGKPSARKQAIRDTFHRSGGPYAGQALATTERLLDDYASRWAEMYKDACEAAHVRGDQSAEVLDLRMSCLQDRLGNIRALTDVLASANERVVTNAPSAAGALPSLDRCADVPLLRAVVKPPEDPATRRRVAELKQDLARFVALRHSGECAAAMAKANTLIAETRATGYLPLLADMLNTAGPLAGYCEDPSAAVDRLKEAYSVASESRHDQAAAEAAVILPALMADSLGQVTMASEWLSIAEAAVRRLGRTSTNRVIDAWLLQTEAIVYSARREYPRALAAARQAVAIKVERLGVDHPDTLLSEGNIGYQFKSAGRLEEALTAHHAARLHAERVLGRSHAFAATEMTNEGEILNKLGRYREARSLLEPALDIFRRVGADPVLVSYPMTFLAEAFLGQGKPREAIGLLEEAEHARMAKNLPSVAEPRFALARALWATPATRSRALALARQARVDLGAESDPSLKAEIDAWLGHGRVASVAAAR